MPNDPRPLTGRLARRGAALTLALALLFGATPLAAQDTGAFFTLVNTYAYPDGPRAGERVLLRARRAFTVVDLTTDAEDVIWYRVVHGERTVRIEGTGWVAQAPHELTQMADEPVLVFPGIPQHGQAPEPALEVPAADLKLANETEASATLPEIIWQKVTYRTTRPARLWVRDPTGIYRPFRSAGALSDVHAEMVARNVEAERVRRLLSGVVRVGDAEQDVRWARGEPTQREESTTEGLQIMVWHYPGMRIRFENEVVKQIN